MRRSQTSDTRAGYTSLLLAVQNEKGDALLSPNETYNVTYRCKIMPQARHYSLCFILPAIYHLFFSPLSLYFILHYLQDKFSLPRLIRFSHIYLYFGCTDESTRSFFSSYAGIYSSHRDGFDNLSIAR